MQIIAINIGKPREEIFFDKPVTTGLCKQPVSTPVFFTTTGPEGDGVADHKHHGGADKAICLYSNDHIAHWHKLLGMDMGPAPFGENLTVAGLDEQKICIGDVFKAGSVTLQVSQPRQPCRTLSSRYGRPDFAKTVVDAGFTGFYCRVLREGKIQKGDDFTLIERDPAGITVGYANTIQHHDRKNQEGIEKILAVAALSESWRVSFQERLQRLQEK